MMMKAETFDLWMIPAVIAVMFLVDILQSGGGEAGLKRWAEMNNLQLISAERRWLSKGPFFLRTGKNAKVYYFVALNTSGQKRSGFARVKPPLTCLFSDPVKIVWEDAAWQ